MPVEVKPNNAYGINMDPTNMMMGDMNNQGKSLFSNAKVG